MSIVREYCILSKRGSDRIWWKQNERMKTNDEINNVRKTERRRQLKQSKWKNSTKKNCFRTIIESTMVEKETKEEKSTDNL